MKTSMNMSKVDFLFTLFQIDDDISEIVSKCTGRDKVLSDYVDLAAIMPGIDWESQKQFEIVDNVSRNDTSMDQEGKNTVCDSCAIM